LAVRFAALAAAFAEADAGSEEPAVVVAGAVDEPGPDSSQTKKRFKYLKTKKYFCLLGR